MAYKNVVTKARTYIVWNPSVDVEPAAPSLHESLGRGATALNERDFPSFPAPA